MVEQVYQHENKRSMSSVGTEPRMGRSLHYFLVVFMMDKL